MIAYDVVPGNPNLADNCIVAFEKRQVVEQDIPQGHAELGFCADQFFHDISGDVIEFFLIPRLWITEENRLELSGFGLAMKRKID